MPVAATPTAPKTVRVVPDPSVVDPWILEMQRKARLPQALMLGTEGMIKHAVHFLPKNPNESDEGWKHRRDTSHLRNYFRRTVQNTTGKLFSKPFQVEGGQAIMKEITYDIDRGGTDIQAFAKDLTLKALGSCGMALFLVDRDTQGDTTAAADLTRPKAPYWVEIDLMDLIALRSEVVDGEKQITQLRYYRTVEKEDPTNPFNTICVRQIRILTKTNWEIWEQQPIGRTKQVRWQVTKEVGENTLGRVPLVPVYFGRKGFYEGVNPLDDLADMNLEHYQIRTEQRRALQINSFPMLAVLNYDGELKDIIAAPDATLGVKGGQGRADIKFIESGGSHLNAGRDELNDLVDQMRAFGAQFDKPGETGTVESASGRVIDAKEATTQLQLWALSLKDSIELGLYWIGRLQGNDGKMESVGKVNMSLDFTQVLSNEDIKLLLEARKLGDLSRKSLLEAYRQNSLLPEDFDFDSNDEEVDQEAADAAALIPPTVKSGAVPPAITNG